MKVAAAKAGMDTNHLEYKVDSSFGQENGKIGDTLRIRLPSQYTRRQGSRVMSIQDSEQQKTSLVMATQDGVDMRFNSREMLLDLENFSKLHLEPAMATLVSGVESDVLQGCTKAVYNTVGTPGTPPTDLVATGAARAKLNQYLAPKDGNRNVQMDSVTMGGLVNGLKGLFQDSQQIKEQYREGLIGRTAMADFYENERTWTMTNSADVAGEVNMAAGLTEGSTVVTVDGFTAAPTAGMVFTFELSKAVHPETKAAYSHLQQFVVVSATTTAITFQPAIFASGPKKNVTVLPLDNDDVVFFGSASTAYQQNLMYHKDAFTFATGELPLMQNEYSCVRKTFDGLSLRVWQGPDIVNDELLTRVDILYGYASIRPQWAARISS